MPPFSRINGSVLEPDKEILVEEEEETKRDNWSSKAEYMFSMVGCIIGLDNIWKFPNAAYKNGGGVFLIPYFLMLIVCGIPLFFLECAIGQFCSEGPVNMWRAVPLLKGVGFSMVMVNALVTIYYNVLIAYSFYYMFASFQSPLPWSNCSYWTDSNCSITSLVSGNRSHISLSDNMPENSTFPTSIKSRVLGQGLSLGEEYWDRVALQRSGDMDETGPVVWHLALCLLLTTILVSVALIKGIKSSGKIMYFTSVLPYLVMLILLIRGVTLEGAGDGIAFFIGSLSDFSRLADVQIWKDAAIQTFYSLAIGWGGVITYTSYNDFHNNVLMDSIFITCFNHGFSVMAGIAVFSMLGHMSHFYGKPVESMVTEGFGLVFIAYPEALTKLPISPLWSILFFSMLAIIGLESQFAMIEVVITTVCDAVTQTFRHKRAAVTIGTCFVLFLLGLPCITQAGIYWVILIDQFAAGWVLSVLALMEVVGFCYIYGVNRLIEDFTMMIGNKRICYWYCRACWYVFSPCIIAVILIWSLIDYLSPSYGLMEYPGWALGLGWSMVVFILIWIPVVAGCKLMEVEGSLWKRVKSLCSPSVDWHPHLSEHRQGRYSK